MYTGCGGRLISSRVHLSLPAEARSTGHSTVQASNMLLNLYFSVFLLFGYPYLKIEGFSTWPSRKSLYCTRSISVYSRGLYRDTGRTHTSCTHFNWIFELMSLLRSNYTLYHGTMPKYTQTHNITHTHTLRLYYLSIHTPRLSKRSILIQHQTRLLLQTLTRVCWWD